MWPRTIPSSESMPSPLVGDTARQAVWTIHILYTKKKYSTRKETVNIPWCVPSCPETSSEAARPAGSWESQCRVSSMKYDLNKFPTDARFVCNKDPPPPNRLPEWGGGGPKNSPVQRLPTLSHLRNLRLPPRLNWIPLSSGLLRGVRWSETDVLGLGPTFKGPAVQEEAWPLKKRQIGNPEKSVLDHLTTRNNTEDGRIQHEIYQYPWTVKHWRYNHCRINPSKSSGYYMYHHA